MKRKKLVYDIPAEEWVEALPMGNGRTGAMAMGYVTCEKIIINHENIWHTIGNRDTVPVSQHLPEIRRLLIDGKWQEAREMFISKLQPTEQTAYALQEYQPACNLMFEIPCGYPPAGYHRELDLETGVMKLGYQINKVSYERMCFVSGTEDIFVLKMKSNIKKSISASFWFNREAVDDYKLTNKAQDNLFILQADTDNSVPFAVVGKVINRGGTLSIDGDRINVTGTDELYVLTAVSTKVESANPLEECLKKVRAGIRDMDRIYNEHIQKHKSVFNRVKFSLGESKKEQLTTDRVIHNIRTKSPDKSYFELLFDMARYLMMSSSSRDSCKPINLQGIWNADMKPAWNSDFHWDMNVQMAYWLAESCNLSECTMPLFRYIESLIPGFEKNAKDIYGCNGILFPIANAGKPVVLAGPWPSWTGGAGWMAQHYWWHYQYTKDKEFLKQYAYPFMKKTAQFYEDFLIKDKNGKYMFAPSMSPENLPANIGEINTVWQDWKLITINATMDIAIARELFTNMIESVNILNADRDKEAAWKEILDNLPDWPVDKNGMLKEWADDRLLDNHSHRHFSQLYPLFPGDMFNETTPELVKAAKKALYGRKSMGYCSSSGWSYSWLANLHARINEGDEAARCLTYLGIGCMLKNFLTVHNDWRFQGYSLFWEYSKKLFQIDAVLGAGAAIAEMLIQSQNNIIKILPALPKIWAKEGSIKGLRARNGFEVGIEWKNGEIKQVEIYSLFGEQCEVMLCRKHSKKINIKSGSRKIEFKAVAKNHIIFDTIKGKKYVLV